MINTYFFLLLKLLDAIAKSRQINWRIGKKKTYTPIYICKDKVLLKINFLVQNFEITEVNELKNIYIKLGNYRVWIHFENAYVT